jgi:hypothetical protein
MQAILILILILILAPDLTIEAVGVGNNNGLMLLVDGGICVDSICKKISKTGFIIASKSIVFLHLITLHRATLPLTIASSAVQPA